MHTLKYYQWHGCSDINFFVDDAPLKNARASWPFCRGSRLPATPAVRKVSGARQNPLAIADNAKTLGYLFARLAGSSDTHKDSTHACTSLCQVKLILPPKQRAKPAASRTRTCTNSAVCIASGECPSRF